MQEYIVKHNGVELTVKLTEATAKRIGAQPVAAGKKSNTRARAGKKAAAKGAQAEAKAGETE